MGLAPIETQLVLFHQALKMTVREGHILLSSIVHQGVSVCHLNLHIFGDLSEYTIIPMNQ